MNMIERIDISKLPKKIEENDFLIVGSPKGVGFTTLIAEWVAEQLFFKDDFSILILVADRKTQIDYKFKILKNYKYYHENGIDSDEFILYTLKNKTSVVGILNYEDTPIELLEDYYDVIIIDSDDFSDRLYGTVQHFTKYCAKLIFNTYDVPQSIFYNMPDIAKVTLKSEYNKQLKKSLQNNYSVTINFDRILDGHFKDFED